MDAQELIQVNLQLPASALDSLSRLTEQLRLLTAEAARQGGLPAERALERGENRSFDPGQFQALRQEAGMAEVRQPLTAERAVESSPEMAAAVVQTREDALAADAVRPEMQRDVYAPEGAERTVRQNMEDPAQAGSSSDGETAEAETVVPDMQEGPSAEAIRQEAERAMEEIPVVQTAVGEISDPESAQPEAESRVPEAETAWEQAAMEGFAPSAVRADVRRDVPDPSGAGLPVSTGPEAPRSRWSGETETRTGAGDPPATAESLSLAFQRDERRYDNGFPLY